MSVVPHRIIFLIQNIAEISQVIVYSNRELVWRWVCENGYVAVEKKGHAPKPITSYRQLCRLFQKRHDLRLLVVRSGEEPERYQVLKLNIISK